MRINMEPFCEIPKIMEIMNREFKPNLVSVLFNIQSSKRILNGEVENAYELLSKKIELIESNTYDLVRLLEQLVDLSHAEFSELQLKKSFINTHDIIMNVIAKFLKQNSSLITIENCRSNSYCTINGDMDRLVQVFFDIIHFLLSLNPTAEKIKVGAKNYNNYTQFQISVEDCPLETTRQPLKARIGLSLAKWTIEAHNGKIWRESNSAFETVFVIEIPRFGLKELKQVSSHV